MPTPREIFGDDGIRLLKEKGYQPAHIYEMAKTAYRSTKEQQEQQLRESHQAAQKMDGSLMRFGTGVAVGALENVRGYMKLAEDTANRLDPRRASATDGQYSAPVAKMGEWISRLQEYEQNWKAHNPEKTNVAGFLGEIGGGFADPINIIPLSAASRAKRILGLTVTGGASGGVAAYGGERNILEGSAVGAIAAPVLGEAIHFTAKGLSKLWAKQKDRRIAEAKNAGDLDDINNNDLLQPFDTKGEATLSARHGDFMEYFSEVMKNEPLHVREQVLRDFGKGKKKSVIDAQRYADLGEFHRYAQTLEEISKREPSLSLMDAELEKMRAQIDLSVESSVKRYHAIAKVTQQEIKANPNILPSQLKTYINTLNPPTQEERMITSWVNDGAMVENRLAGWNVLHALEADIAMPTRTPEEYMLGLSRAGFNEEVATVLAQAYAQKDATLAKQFFNEKITTKGAEHVTAKGEAHFRQSHQNSSGDVGVF